MSDARELYYTRQGGGGGVPTPTRSNLAAIRAAVAASMRAQAARAAADQARQRAAWEAQKYRNIAAGAKAPKAPNYGTGAINNAPGYQSWAAYRQEAAAAAYRAQIASAMRLQDARLQAQRQAASRNARALIMEHQGAIRERNYTALQEKLKKTAMERAKDGNVMLLTRVAQSALWADPEKLGTSSDTSFARMLGAAANEQGLADELRWETSSGEYRFWMPDASMTAPDGTPYPPRDEDIEGRFDENQFNKEGGFIEGSVFPNSRMNIADKYAQWASADKAKKQFDDMPEYVRQLAYDAALQKFGPDMKPGSDKTIWNKAIDATLQWNKSGDDGEGVARSVTDSLAMGAEGFDFETTSMSEYIAAKAAGAIGTGYQEPVRFSGSSNFSDTTYSSGGGGGYGGYDSYGSGYGGGGGGQSATQSLVELSDRGTAQKLLNNAAYALMGRAATDAEVDAFLSALNAQEQANPTVVTASVGADGTESSTKKDGYSMESREELAKSTLRATPEAGAEQMGTTFANMLWNAVTSATAGESSTNQGVF